MNESDIGTINFDSLLDEIETGSSGSLATVVRKLREYEVAAYNAGIGGPTGQLVANFTTSLEARIKEHNLSIESTCSNYYETFVNSARELLSVQENACKIKDDLQSVNEEVHTAVDELKNSCKELSECKITLDRLDQCIEALQISLPVLDQYCRIEQSIKEGRFYHALRNLEDLEHSQLGRIREYSFAEIIIRRIPKTRASIKNASLAELTDFLEHIRKNSVILGALAMREISSNTTGKVDNESESLTVNDTVTRKTNNSLATSSSQSHGLLNDLPTTLESELILFDKIVNLNEGTDEQNVGSNVSEVTAGMRNAHSKAEDLVDFGPVYRCLHIHSVLNERAEFERYYCSQRRKQWQLSLSLSPNQQTSMRNYSEFFSSICGFFVVDDYLRHTLPGSSPYYHTYLDELWLNTVNRLVDFARANATACATLDDLKRLKDHALIFEQTMANLGFPTTGLLEIVTFIQRRHYTLLLEKWKEKFETIITEDRYTPISLETTDQLNNFCKLYPFGRPSVVSQSSLPKQLNYSWMVPHCYQVIRDFIRHSHEFCSNMDLSQTEMDDALVSAVHGLFNDCFNPILIRAIRKNPKNLPYLVQICNNLDEFEKLCGYLDDYLHSTLILSPSDTGNILNGDGGEDVPGAGVSTVQTDDVSSKTNQMPKMGKTRRLASIVHQKLTNLSQLSTYMGDSKPPRSKLQGARLLKSIRNLVEDMIYNYLDNSVAEFIVYKHYDDENGNKQHHQQVVETNNNAKSRADGHRDCRDGYKVVPSENICDLTTWLKSTFHLFDKVPPRVSQMACMSVCKTIARLLNCALLGTQVATLSDAGLYQLRCDLNQCELFIHSNPVPGLDISTLLLIFADLHQLLDLFLKDDWAAYISSRKQSDGKPYDRVSPSMAIHLLERLLEAEKKRIGFFEFRSKEEREHRKKIEQVVRQLRELDTSRPH